MKVTEATEDAFPPKSEATAVILYVFASTYDVKVVASSSICAPPDVMVEVYVLD